MNPLIVSLAIDDEAQARFDRLRREYFPPARHVVGAHVTLFHALPGRERTGIEADLHEVTAGRPPFGVGVTGVRSIGRGVAYHLRSPEIDDVRARLAARWDPWLTAQDRQPFRPHVTVQNKVTPAEAAATLALLAAAFSPEEVIARGLDLWWYVGGPWEHAAHHPFPAPGGDRT